MFNYSFEHTYMYDVHVQVSYQTRIFVLFRVLRFKFSSQVTGFITLFVHFFSQLGMGKAFSLYSFVQLKSY